MKTTTKTPTAWTYDEDHEGELWHSIKDAVIAYAEDNFLDDSIPETVTVYGYAPMDMPDPEREADDVLSDLLERLDEEYANWEDFPTEPTESVRNAALEFIKAVYAEYRVWRYDKVCSEVVKVADYY